MFAVYWLAVSLLTIGSSLAQKKMCSKIFFQNVNEELMPWIQAEGVYDLFSENNNFPVYLNKPSGLFFYYADGKEGNVKVLLFGHKIGEIYGLAAQLAPDFDPPTWLSSGTLNKNDLFGDIVKVWMYYSPLDKSYKKIERGPNIKAICVDDDYFQCDSGKLYFNDTITGSGGEVLNDPRTDYFANVPGVYRSVRPVLRHSRQNWYLYYRNGYWMVGSSYSSPNGDYFRVRDLALRPEYITHDWEYLSGSEWTTVSGLRIKCRGIANGVNKCHGASTCTNRGTCVYTTGNETVCLCEDSAYGAACESRELCSDPGVPDSSVSVAYTGKRPGDIATSFCVTGYISSPTEFYICEQDNGRKSWMLESQQTCRAPSPVTVNPETNAPKTVPPRPYSTEMTISPDGEDTPERSEGFMIFVIAFFACHVLCPVFIWLAMILTTFARCSSRTQVGTTERSKAVGKIMDTRYMLMVRTFSAFFNFAFWVWFCSVCVCLSTHEEGSAHSPLFYWAAAMCGFCALFVAIEAFFSVERKGLSRIITWEYIQSLHRTPPVVEMQIEWYNWQTYRYAEYSTNPVTGRREYQGTREATVKVGRKLHSEPFSYTSWTDQSQQEIPCDGQILRVKISLDVSMDAVTSRFFEAQKFALVEKTQHLNKFYDFSRKDRLPDLHTDVVLCPNKDSVPPWMNEIFFWGATLLQLSWVYRWLFISRTRSVEYTLKKKVFCADSPSSTRLAGFQQANPGNFPVKTGFMSSEQESAAVNQPLIKCDHNSSQNYMSV